MIEINLLPQELKHKPKKPGIDFESKETLYFIPLVVGVILILHVFLGGILVLRNFQAVGMNARWQKLESQRKALEVFRSEAAHLSADALALQQIHDKTIKWAPKLNKLSLDLPSGIWFRSINFTSNLLDIRASVVSLKMSELVLINQYIDNLKKDNDFFADFSKLDLDSVEKKKIGGYEIAEFSLAAKPKEK